LRSAGLDRINVSVDTLDERRYRALTGGRLDRVLAGLTAAARAGPRPLKLNTVLQRTVNGDQLRQLVELAADLDAEARFIELMPLGSAGRDHYHRQFLSAGEALARLREELRYEGPLPREADGATARRHRFRTPAGAAVTVGLIAPVSAPFCASCDRLRLDCRGRLHTCIRARHAVELAPLLTRRGELRAALRRALAAKAPADCWPDRNMLALGG